MPTLLGERARGPIRPPDRPTVSAAVPVGAASFVYRCRLLGDGPLGRVGPAALEAASPPGLATLAGGPGRAVPYSVVLQCIGGGRGCLPPEVCPVVGLDRSLMVFGVLERGGSVPVVRAGR
ncbi:hypothetical protein NDU88_010039 [Pleurodeles waltl]|uniref:Uncharacterized protein n=1 Tax=Pleurodeles waltl TaxID=8319 RepID=A0AAV7S247_PLEWA|nr:hypothetical protein NDU88_010039 [Pleurodeles waltl]